MQIRRFKARTMTEALRAVKNEFGPEAVIISARNLKRGKGIFGKQSDMAVEVTAATDTYIPPSLSNAVQKPSVALNSYRRGQVTAKPSHLAKAAQSGVVTSLGFKKDKPRKSERLLGSHTKSLFNLYTHMCVEGLDEDIALMLTRGINSFYQDAAFSIDNDVAAELMQLVEEMGLTTKRIKLRKGKPRLVAFVGPAGVGKTTTAAKIAALGQAHLKSQNVGMISLDDFKLGAFQQAKTYAQVMGIQIECVTNRKEFALALRKFKSKDFILIDTPGVDPKHKDQLQSMARYLSRLGALEIHLLLSAETKSSDMADCIERFSFLPVSHLLFTKLDATTTYGNILGQLIRTQIPASYFSTGRDVPEDIEGASLEKLIGRLIKSLDREIKLKGSPEIIAQRLSLFEKMIEIESDDDFAQRDDGLLLKSGVNGAV